MTRTGLLTRKLGMTHRYREDGTQIPVTVLAVDAVTVVGHRTTEKDGYQAVIVGAGSTRRLNRSQKAWYDKIGQTAKAKLVEFRVDTYPDVGSPLLASHFEAGTRVDVSAVSIGKGFAGAMKRHNFSGLRASHGVSVSHRAHGSTGQRQDPGKVFKGKKMAGHMGARKTTCQNLTVFACDDERGLLMVKGAVPGPSGGWVTVIDAKKS